MAPHNLRPVTSLMQVLLYPIAINNECWWWILFVRTLNYTVCLHRYQTAQDPP